MRIPLKEGYFLKFYVSTLKIESSERVEIEKLEGDHYFIQLVQDTELVVFGGRIHYEFDE